MDDEMLTLSRKAAGDLEVLHVCGYFAQEVSDAYVELGLHKRLSYFPSRAAAFGRAGTGLTVATFYVFAPWLVQAGLEDGWSKATPEQLVEARRVGMSRALRRILGQPDVAEALEIARDVCTQLTPAGRPLYAAHAELPWPDDDLLALWHAATLVREHRGDGHLAVLQQARLDPVEATLMGGLWSGTTTFLRKTRGWSDEEYDAATARLRDRGWVDDDGLTDSGRAARQGIEDDTDRLAVGAWAAVGAERTARLRELLRPWRRTVQGSGLLPTA